MFGSRPAVILSVLLLAQAGVFYGFSRNEKPPAHRPLDQFPQAAGNWRMIREGVMEPEIKDVLRADDYLTRDYLLGANGPMANLFVAFFNTQRTGQTPHSPKNCLPGSGWIWTVSDMLPIAIEGRANPIVVNRYIVQKGDDKSLVLYWYQSRDRVVAGEFAAKAYVVADALRYNRTDTALVRVVVPAGKGADESATRTGIEFVQTVFNPLRQYFPQ